MKDPIFISFIVKDNDFQAFISVQGIVELEGDLELITNNAIEIYKYALNRLNILIIEKNNLVINHDKVPARLIWNIGNEIFLLINDSTAKTI